MVRRVNPNAMEQNAGQFVLPNLFLGPAPGPAGVSGLLATGDLQAYEYTGWNGAGEVWTYASPSTFTVPEDKTAKYRKGTRLAWTDSGGQKYGTVVGSSYGAPNTTVTIAASTGHVIANSAITTPLFSYADCPRGYPDYFSYTPTWASSGVQPAIGNGTLLGLFSIRGGVCTAWILLVAGSTTTFGTGNYTFSVPVAPAFEFTAVALAVDNGATFYVGATLYGGGASLLVVDDGGSIWSPSAPFTWGNGDAFRITALFTY